MREGEIAGERMCDGEGGLRMERDVCVCVCVCVCEGGGGGG